MSSDYHPIYIYIDDIYYTTDHTLIYTVFFDDFGPIDLGLTCLFCSDLEETIKK